VEIADVGEVCREEDLASLCAHYTVSAREKSMQMRVAVRAGIQDVIRVLNHERVVAPGDKLHEDLVAFERTRVGGIEDLCALALSTRHRGEDRAHKASLSGSRWTLKNEHRLARVEIPPDEPIDRLVEGRIGLIKRRRISEFFERSAGESCLARREMPIDRERLLADPLITHDGEQAVAHRYERCLANGPDRKCQRGGIGMA